VALAGYYFLAGGLGLKATILFAPDFIGGFPPDARPKLELVFAAISAVFAIVLITGVMLERRWRFAVPAAIAVQVVQIPLWSLHGSKYQFLAGLYAGTGWSALGMNAFAGWKASIQFALESQSTDLFVGINVVPVLIILLLRNSTAFKVDEASRPQARAEDTR
jgi:hypothetical protein